MTKRMKILMAALMVTAVGAAAVPTFAALDHLDQTATTPVAGQQVADNYGYGRGRFDNEEAPLHMRGRQMGGAIERPAHGRAPWVAPAWATASAPARKVAVAPCFFEKYDTNNDGQISKDEINAVRADQLKKFDTNGDGVLSLEEYQALWLDQMHPLMVRSFQRFDVDGNGTVTPPSSIATSTVSFSGSTTTMMA